MTARHPANAVRRPDPTNLVPLAREALDLIERIADWADKSSAAARPAQLSSLAMVHTLNSGAAVQSLAAIGEERLVALLRLAKEPAIARVIAMDEYGERRTLYVARAVPDKTMPPGVPVANYFSPMGRLASIPVGEEAQIRVDGKSRTYEVLEKARLRPVRRGGEWDSTETVLERLDLKPLTISSLRDLLRSEDIPDEEIDILAALLDEQRDHDVVFDGIRRAVIEKVGLRDQPLLDRYQDEIFRLPIDTRLAIMGPPGSGKTTTLIKRLGQKLALQHLEADEFARVARSLAGEGEHASSWLMFTPSDLLKLYVTEAFNQEGIPAPDDRIRTWESFRRDLARNRLEFLRTANTAAGYVLRTGEEHMAPATLSRQVAWFEDFRAWQVDALRAELDVHSDRLARHDDGRMRRVARRISSALEGASGLDASSVMALVDVGPEVTGIARELRKAVDDDLRKALSTELRKEVGLLDSLVAFLRTIGDSAEVGEDPDDPETEDEGEGRRRSPREEAFEAYRRAMSALALSKVGGRSVGRRTRNGQVIDWLGAKVPDDETLKRLGRTLQAVGSLRRFANPITQYLNRIPARYRAFRRDRQAQGIWYAETPIEPSDLNGLEADIVLLAMLRTANELVSVWTEGDTPSRFPLLNRIREMKWSQVLVDEATDFSPIQLACMAELVDPAVDGFLACGDFNQRLTRWGARSEDDFQWVAPGIDVRSIVVSYRHSRQLNEFAGRLAALSDTGAEPARLPEHMAAEGYDPVLGLDLSGPPLAAWLAARIGEIEEAMETLPSIAVLVNGETAVDEVAKALDDALADRNIRCVACPAGQVKGQEQDVRVFDVQHIKGLEFEAVFFLGVDRLAREQTDLFEKFLYVGATRAATYLGVTCEGTELPVQLTPLRASFGDSWSRNGRRDRDAQTGRA